MNKFFNIKVQKNFTLLSTVLLLILVLPQFPTFLNNSIYINFFGLYVFSLLLLINSNLDKNALTIFVFFFIMQMLTFVSGFNEIISGNLNIKDFPSIFRHTMLLIVAMSLYSILKKFSSKKVLWVLHLSCLAIFIFSLYSILDLFIPGFENVKYFLYIRESKFSSFYNSISFFISTYFAGYIYYSFGIIIYCYFLQRRSVYLLIFTCLTTLLILFAQSKSILIVWFLSLWLAPIINARSYLKTIGIIILSTLFFVPIVYLLYVNSEHIRSVDRLVELVNNPQQFVTIDNRVEQVLFAINSSKQNFFFGSGLGRDILLESWVSEIIYRYGIVGFLFYIIFYIVLFLKSFRVFKNTKNLNLKSLMLALSLWSLMLPLSQFSSMMFESGKMSFVSMLFVALIFRYSRACSKNF